MAESKIEWTDRVWTPIVGCTPVSPACANCYAAPMAARLEAMGQAKYAGLATREGSRGKWTGKVTLWEPEVLAPLHRRKPTRWFLTSMGDVGHPDVPGWFLDRLFAVMALTPHHTFYVLTKRPDRVAAYLEAAQGNVIDAWRRIATPKVRVGCGAGPVPWPLRNVLIGCTAEGQSRAEERRQHMERIAAAGWRTFVSYEPALGMVDWSGWDFLSWLTSGGESGPHARPSHPDWHRAARDWCADHGIPYFFKQWGEWAPQLGAIDLYEFGEQSRRQWAAWDHDRQGWEYWDRPLWCDDLGAPEDCLVKVGKSAAGHLLDGVEHRAAPGVRHG